MSHFFKSGGQSMGDSASASVLRMSIQYSGLISFRIDWVDLLAVQGTLKSFLHHHNSKASLLWYSAFFVVQLSYPYMTTGKNHSFDYTDLCRQSDVCAFQYAVLVCHSFPSKEETSFNFVATVTIHRDFGALENKICHCFHFFPIYLP